MSHRKALSNDDLGEHAHRLAASWFSNMGIQVNDAHRDRRGWDIYAELPNTFGASETAEVQPSELSCFIQIKGTRSKKKSQAIKLSNWTRGATTPVPVFFLILEFSALASLKEVYLVHLGPELYKKVMQRLRILTPAEAEQLHRKNMLLKWNNEHRLHEPYPAELDSALRRFIGVQESYVSRKLNWFHDIGQDGLRLSFSVRGETDAERYNAMADFAIGARKVLPISMLVAEHLRFDIAKPVAGLPAEVGEIGWPRQVACRASVAFSSDDYSDSAELECGVLAAHLLFPFLPAEHRKFRLVTPLVTITVVPPATVTYTLHLSPDVSASLGEVTRSAKALRLMMTEPGPHLQVRIGSKTLSYHLAKALSESNGPPAYAALLEHAGASLPKLGVPEATRVEIGELHRQRKDIELLWSAIANRSITLEISGTKPVPGRPRRIGMVHIVRLRLGEENLVAVVAGDGAAEWSDDGMTAAVSDTRFRIEAKWFPVVRGQTVDVTPHLIRLVTKLAEEFGAVFHPRPGGGRDAMALTSDPRLGSE